MFDRFLSLAVPCCAAYLVAACGTTTTVDTPSPLDAGCPDSSAVKDAGGELPTPEAGAAQCPMGVCNYQAQTGCSTGEACRPQFTASSPEVAPGCEPAGSGRAGAACATGSDCAAGYFCAQQSCRKQCCAGDWSACDPGESCFRQLEVEAGGTIVDSGMELCFPVSDCDPLDPASCSSVGADLACTIVDATGAVACEPAGTAQPGDPCSATASCASGALCDLGQCRALCRASVCGEAKCDAGQGTCVHSSGDPAGVGECTGE